MTNLSLIKFPWALNHGSATLVINAEIKYQVHVGIIIYHLHLIVGSPFKNRIIILLIGRRNTDIIDNTLIFSEILVQKDEIKLTIYIFIYLEVAIA